MRVAPSGWSARALGILIAGSLVLELPLGLNHQAQNAHAQTRADLRVIRTPDAVTLLLQRMGSGTEVSINRDGDRLSIDLATSQAFILNGGVRQLALPDAGFASIEMSGQQRSFNLSIEPLPGRRIQPPVVSQNGVDLRLTFKAAALPAMTSGSYDLTQPGLVPTPTYVPPLRKRATAPPVGDMAVGSMLLRNPSFVPLKGPSVTLTTRNAPPRDVLMLLAKMGGYNFAYSGSGSSENNDDNGGTPITVSFNEEPLDQAFNFVLLSSGLQAKLEGRTVLVGSNVLMKTTGNQVSRVYRLNQVSPDGAADYLANLGATITKTNTITTTSNESSSTGVSTANASASTSQTSEQTVIESFGASQGPLLGLIGTTDKRLGTITLIGNSYLVSIAENYLKQLDLRKRQVAVNVKILNVDLENDSRIRNDFSTMIGDTFIVSNNGQAMVNFGKLKPAAQGGGLRADGTTPLVGAYPFQLPEDQMFEDVPYTNTPYSPPGRSQGSPWVNYPMADRIKLRTPRPGFGPYSNPQQPGVIDVTETDDDGTKVYEYEFETPKNFKYPQNQLFDYLTALVESRNSKTISNPTLLVQEGESAEVQAVESVITDVQVTDNTNSTTTTTTTREDAGLSLKVQAEKIDDNGFITLSLEPEVSVAIPGDSVSAGGLPIQLYNISKRQLDSGKIRLRDGQTLILTGVMTDAESTLVRKWPVLGDIPFFGQFFRSSSTDRRKRELIIVVTPRIINDEQGGSYGYGFRPQSQEARKLIYTR